MKLVSIDRALKELQNDTLFPASCLVLALYLIKFTLCNLKSAGTGTLNVCICTGTMGPSVLGRSKMTHSTYQIQRLSKIDYCIKNKNRELQARGQKMIMRMGRP